MRAEPDRPLERRRSLGARLIRLAALGGLLLGLAGCVPPDTRPAARKTLTVFAAASLRDAMEAIGESYEQAHPETDVVFNFAASSALRAQLGEGAAADVVAFAAERDMQLLAAAGLADSTSVKIFAENEMVVVVHPASASRITALEDLTGPAVKLVMAAEGVPAGDYARQVLENLTATLGASYRELVLTNVVSEEDNVRQVLAKVELGEADAGWVYRSDAQSAPELRVLAIPEAANVRAKYPIAVLLSTQQPASAQGFVDLVLSPDGQRMLEKGGFLPVAP